MTIKKDCPHTKLYTAVQEPHRNAALRAVHNHSEQSSHYVLLCLPESVEIAILIHSQHLAVIRQGKLSLRLRTGL